jgi:hypothetical protein
MRWEISIEGSDDIRRGRRFEFEIDKTFDNPVDGSVGLSTARPSRHRFDGTSSSSADRSVGQPLGPFGSPVFRQNRIPLMSDRL